MGKIHEIQFYKFTSANRTSYIPKTSEGIWETDTKKFYVGDGVTAGGILIGGGTGGTDHGSLSGLGDDDHTQYHNDTRGDARYYQQSTIDSMMSNKADVSQLPPSSWAQVTNTDTTTNLNTGTNFSTDVPLVGTYSDDGGSDFSQNGSTGVDCNFNGEVEISVNLHLVSASTRPNVRARIKKEETPVGPVSACSYIRQSNGHSESSVHIATFRLSVVSGDTIEVGTDQEANAGTVTMQGSGTSSMYIKRVS